jgi:hypothetical protein
MYNLHSLLIQSLEQKLKQIWGEAIYGRRIEGSKEPRDANDEVFSSSRGSMPNLQGPKRRSSYDDDAVWPFTLRFGSCPCFGTRSRDDFMAILRRACRIVLQGINFTDGKTEKAQRFMSKERDHCPLSQQIFASCLLSLHRQIYISFTTTAQQVDLITIHSRCDCSKCRYREAYVMPS